MTEVERGLKLRTRSRRECRKADEEDEMGGACRYGTPEVEAPRRGDTKEDIDVKVAAVDGAGSVAQAQEDGVQ